MKRKIPQGKSDGHDRIVERSDGFYWRSEDRRAEHGPFPSQLEAVTDMQLTQDSDYEPEESPEQAEKETGMASWIDPDTGEPAEQWVPRLEDH